MKYAWYEVYFGTLRRTEKYASDSFHIGKNMIVTLTTIIFLSISNESEIYISKREAIAETMIGSIWAVRLPQKNVLCTNILTFSWNA